MAGSKHLPCEFCDEFAGGINNSFRLLFAENGLSSRIVKETQHFTALPGLGSLLPGYVLVLPKTHVFNISQLDINLFDELEFLIKTLRQYLQNNLKMKTVIFEHGATPEASCGACIDHAHIHICPTKKDLNPKPNNSTEYTITELHQLCLWGKQNKPYIFYEDLNGRRFVHEPLKPIPSQYLRKLWANTLSVSDCWDWALFPMKENIIKTIQMFTHDD